MRKLPITLLLVLLGMIFIPNFSMAARSDELQLQIEARAREIQQLEQEVAQHEKQVEQLGGEKKTLQSEIKVLDVTRTKLSKDIQITEKKLDTTLLTIEELAIEIKDKEIRIARNHESVSKIIRLLHESSKETLLELLLANEKLSDVFSDAENLSRIEIDMTKHLDDLKILKDEYSKRKSNEETAKKELQRLSSQILDQKKLADDKRKEQASLLKETQNKESNFKKLVDDKKKRIDSFNKEIADFENQLRIELDPSSIPQVGSKALAWPLDQVSITQKFGGTQSAKRLYLSGTHNGIDLRASVGTPIKAAASGVVIGTGDTDLTCRWASYGRWVLIRHNNGLSTLYGHLDLIRVKEGEQVSVGNTIGYSGNTGYSTGPHLHFTVFASAAVRVEKVPSRTCSKASFTIPVSPHNGYLNPEDYLWN